MKATVQVDCNTAGELVQHLGEIIKTIKICSKDNPKHDFKEGLKDKATYERGKHEIEIKP